MPNLVGYAFDEKMRDEMEHGLWELVDTKAKEGGAQLFRLARSTDGARILLLAASPRVVESTLVRADGKRRSLSQVPSLAGALAREVFVSRQLSRMYGAVTFSLFSMSLDVPTPDGVVVLQVVGDAVEE